MWIETTRFHDDGRPVTKSLKLPEMSEAVTFSENGKANVSAEVGEYLINEVESITNNEYESKRESGSGTAES